MTETEESTALWVAYGAEGRVLGTVRRVGQMYSPTVADADTAVGEYPSLEIAKGALRTHLSPGAAWSDFREH